MNPTPIGPERTGITLKGLPASVRVLLTCFLLTIGLGYFFALTYLFLLDIEPHRKEGVGLIQGTIIKYYGSRSNTRLEAALQGSMAEMISPGDKAEVIAWLRRGATAEGYEKIRPILERNCTECHRKDAGYGVVPLTRYEQVLQLAQLDLGTSIRTLARVSHVHLFGLSFIFLLTGAIFSMSETSRRLKLIVLVLPFIAIWMDIGSWWITKFEPIFAYTVIIGGGLMGLALAAQILIPLWEMWVKGRRPSPP